MLRRKTGRESIFVSYLHVIRNTRASHARDPNVQGFYRVVYMYEYELILHTWYLVFYTMAMTKDALNT